MRISLRHIGVLGPRGGRRPAEQACAGWKPAPGARCWPAAWQIGLWR